MKSYAVKNRTKRQFAMGYKVLFKLQSYVQQSVVNRPYPKLPYKYLSPYEVLERISAVAYLLQLPPPATEVHPVFHVSLLKPFTANYSPFYSELPNLLDLTTVTRVPAAIPQRLLVRKGKTCQMTVQPGKTTMSSSNHTKMLLFGTGSSRNEGGGQCHACAMA